MITETILNNIWALLERKDAWVYIQYSHNSQLQMLYCYNIEDREEVWKALTRPSSDPYYQYLYCKRVNDREEVWKALANNTTDNCLPWKYWYCNDVKSRPQMYVDPAILTKKFGGINIE